MNIFCSKKGHQIYPLEIERIDKDGNIFVRSCRECDEKISDVVEQIKRECEEGESLLNDVINALEEDELASTEMLNTLEEAKRCFWSIERLV